MISKPGIVIALLFGVAASLVAQTGEVSRAVTVSDNAGRSRMLTFGMDPTATDGIDVALGENQLPPMPPGGAFDARFVGEDISIALGQGSWVDYRQGSGTWSGIKSHEIKYQTGSGLTITIAWNFPTWASGQLQDVITGGLIDVPMSGTGSYTVTNPSAFSKLKMSITYDLPLPIQLVSFSATQISSNRVRLDWTTLTEVNNYGFFIERKTSNEIAFTELPNSFVPGHGTTNVPHHYEYFDGGVPAGSWVYRLKQVDLDGTIHYSDPIHIDVITGVKEFTPVGFSLLQNYPNPFNPSTDIVFSVESSGPATLQVFNTLGQKVMMVFDGYAETGRSYHLRIDASNLCSGTYFYELRSGTRSEMKRFLLMK